MNLMTALLLSALAGETTEQTLTIEPAANVAIHNVSGSVRVTTHDRPEVKLTATLGHHVKELVFRRHGQGAVIRVENERNENSSSDLVVVVPRQASVEVHVVNADVDVDTGGQDLEIATVNGDVRGKTTASDVKLRTVSGDIRLEAATVEVELATVNGELDLKAAKIEALRAKTVSGDLRLDAKALGRGPFRVKSQSGDLDLSVPDSVPVRIEKRGFSGKKRIGDESKNAVVFDVDSFSGDVEIKRR